MPNNPGKYIQTQALLGQNGTVGAAVRNNSPVTAGGIVVKVEYIDDNGQLRAFSKNIRKTLQPGEQTAVATGLGGIPDTNQLARRVRVTVTNAEPVQQET